MKWDIKKIKHLPKWYSTAIHHTIQENQEIYRVPCPSQRFPPIRVVASRLISGPAALDESSKEIWLKTSASCQIVFFLKLFQSNKSKNQSIWNLSRKLIKNGEISSNWIHGTGVSIHEWLNSMVKVGRYLPDPMDPMGLKISGWVGLWSPADNKRSTIPSLKRPQETSTLRSVSLML